MSGTSSSSSKVPLEIDVSVRKYVKSAQLKAESFAKDLVNDLNNVVMQQQNEIGALSGLFFDAQTKIESLKKKIDALQSPRKRSGQSQPSIINEKSRNMLDQNNNESEKQQQIKPAKKASGEAESQQTPKTTENKKSNRKNPPKKSPPKTESSHDRPTKQKDEDDESPIKKKPPKTESSHDRPTKQKNEDDESPIKKKRRGRKRGVSKRFAGNVSGAVFLENFMALNSDRNASTSAMKSMPQLEYPADVYSSTNSTHGSVHTLGSEDSATGSSEEFNYDSENTNKDIVITESDGELSDTVRNEIAGMGYAQRKLGLSRISTNVDQITARQERIERRQQRN